MIGKELRVASRRRRNYVLRAVYLLIFTAIFSLMWAEFAFTRASYSIYEQARLSQIGMAIVSFTVWFQFIAAQFIAIVLLSTAVSDEIYGRTLGVLMTTPINSFHIVAGKLTGRLYQLLLLICLSFPVLAIIRVFGGIPWGYLLSSLAVTACAVIFLGSVSLFFSVFCRRSYVTIINSLAVAAFLFLFIPLMVMLALDAANYRFGSASHQQFVAWLWSLYNPWGFLAMETARLDSPRGMPSGPPLYLHCMVLLSASAVIIALAAAFVRRAALRQIAGGESATSARQLRKGRRNDDRIVPVKGSPVLWKELHTPLFKRRKVMNIVAIVLGLIFLAGTYILFLVNRSLDSTDTQMFYLVAFGITGTLFAVAIPATAISTEKESMSWFLLLTTTLDDWSILAGKAVGSLRRVLPYFLLLAGHATLFVLVGINGWPLLLLAPVPIIGTVLFLTGTGLYFSTRFKHTTTAVVANFLLALTLWVGAPIVISIFGELADLGSASTEWLFFFNPFVHMMVVMAASAGTGSGVSHNVYRSGGAYDFPGYGHADAGQAFLLCLLLAVAYALAGFLFAWRAKLRFRKNIF